jgi:predicted nucleic acid-binding protein
VKLFLDTSVIVASVRTSDRRHTASREILNQCDPARSFCAAHSLAEIYANLTGMQPPNRFRPGDAIQVLEQVRLRFTVVELTADEVFKTAQRLADQHRAGGIVYDALLLACARKVDADRIYTWNLRHFEMVAPDLKERIVTP